MAAEASSRKNRTELARAVEQEIMRHTWGRLHHLHVEVTDRILIQGCATSYYGKQLAIQAGLKAINGKAELPLELDIQVVDGPAAPPWPGDVGDD